MFWVWLVVALAALLVASLVGLAARSLVGRVHRSLPRPAPHARLPVVLAHGVLGFDELSVGPARVDYFRGVAQHLAAFGAEVHSARLPPLASIQVRAQRLAEMVRALDAPRVNLVAHSMGGLDARYAISRLGLADRVASLVTIGTPHRGTPVADLGAETLRRLRLGPALGALFDMDALHDLTTSRMLAFNREVRDSPDVLYLSVVARAPRGAVHPLLRIAHRWMLRVSGDNDGLVPARSQRWGRVLREIHADHWSQIGWSSDFDALTLYYEILQELRALGL